MTSKAIMTTDGSIGHTLFSTVSGGAFVIAPGQDTANFKIDGANVYKGPLEYSFSGGSATGFVAGSVETIDDVGAPVTNTIDPGAPKTEADGSPIMRLVDNDVMICWGVPTSTPPNKALVPSALVIVATAGQSNVRSH